MSDQTAARSPAMPYLSPETAVAGAASVLLTIGIGQIFVSTVRFWSIGSGGFLFDIPLAITVALACLAFSAAPALARTISGTTAIVLGVGMLTVLELLEDIPGPFMTAAAQMALVGAVVLGGAMGRMAAESFDQRDGLPDTWTLPLSLRIWRWTRGILAGCLAALALTLPGSMPAGNDGYSLFIIFIIAAGIISGICMGTSWTALPATVIALVIFTQWLATEDGSLLGRVYEVVYEPEPYWRRNRQDAESANDPGVFRALQLGLLLAAAAIPIMVDRARDFAEPKPR